MSIEHVPLLSLMYFVKGGISAPFRKPFFSLLLSFLRFCCSPLSYIGGLQQKMGGFSFEITAVFAHVSFEKSGLQQGYNRATTGV